jgi:hypothetical protein
LGCLQPSLAFTLATFVLVAESPLLRRKSFFGILGVAGKTLKRQ